MQSIMENSIALNSARDDPIARNRFESFKLGSGPSTMAKRHSHSRSHSRNASISSTSALLPSQPAPASSNSMHIHDMSTFSFPAAAAPTPSNPVALSPPTKRNSHHRRRSSVSTRRESAELMGVSVPDLPPSVSEDNVNFGDKDSIRRRALWALEGKPEVAFTRVEIPDITTPDIEKMMFEFPTKPSFPPGPGTGFGANPMASKRDSFKLLASSSSSKDQLHTLVEEEEEEEEEETQVHTPLASAPPAPFVAPVVAVTKPSPARPRPANLSLRPLSLASEKYTTVQGLPTPSLTPSPRSSLKSLSLAPTFPISPVPSDESTNASTTAMNKRQSISPSRPSLHINVSDSFSQSSTIEETKAARRSSIGYKSSSGLPTPEMTPTSFERRSSVSSAARSTSGSSNSSSSDDGFFPSHPVQARPLSASEQHFLFKSHNALLARITDLERALSMRRRSSGGYSHASSSRPVSLASDCSSSSEVGEPSDEMLRLIADLKAERDELKRDVDGWRTRVGNMEKQLTMFANRIENERRDAWVARSTVGLLEVEKGVLEKRLEGIEKAVQVLEAEAGVLRGEKADLILENEANKRRVQELEQQLALITAELEVEKQARQTREAEDAMATPTPTTFAARQRLVGQTRRGLGFTSVDSESSVTDVESEFHDDNAHTYGQALKVVEEESESDHDTIMSEEENDLAGYEDEQDSDMSFSISPSSSFGSQQELPRSVSHLRIDVPTGIVVTSPSTSEATTPTVRSRSASPEPEAQTIVVAPRPTHASRASLSKTWSFRAASQAASKVAEYDEIDRFFGCLDDMDADTGSAPASPDAYTFEKSKSIFCDALKQPVEGNIGFYTLGMGIVEQGLDVISEGEEEEESADATEEDDSDMFGEAGGIFITCTPPEADEPQLPRAVSPVKKPTPSPEYFEEESDNEESVPFNFGRPVHPVTPKVSTPPMISSMITPPSSIPRPNVSCIPRPTSPLKPLVETTPTKPTSACATPRSSYATNTFVTPPTKRGGTMPSFIPQPVSSPSPIKSLITPAKQHSIPTPNSNPTFVRQPQRRPLMSANGNISGPDISPASGTYVNLSMNTRSPPRRSPECAEASTTRTHAGSEMISVDLSSEFPQHSDPKLTTPAPTSFSSMISLQTFTNFIPLSWGSRTTTAAPPPARVAPVLCLPPIVPSPQSRREKQLEKLKKRMRLEGATGLTVGADVCKNCDSTVVFL
ncbi:hypothetical protein BD779DRAFT_1489245 [Infundibulicybe gibba]|nr:hypothetical protein BD779DRAFT_1489245 [Infundibulicybe gibba]